MKKLYKFYKDSRYGNIEGLFIADEKEIENAVGEEVIFSETIDKLIDEHETINESEIFEVEGISKQTIEDLERVIGRHISGYNPLDCIVHTCDRCEITYGLDETNFYLTNEGCVVCYECTTEEERDMFEEI